MLVTEFEAIDERAEEVGGAAKLLASRSIQSRKIVARYLAVIKSRFDYLFKNGTMELIHLYCVVVV